MSMGMMTTQSTEVETAEVVELETVEVVDDVDVDRTQV